MILYKFVAIHPYSLICQVSEPQQLGSIAARLMEQLYYKPDTLIHSGNG